MVKYIEIKCKSALNKVDHGSFVCYDLNIYRGCIHQCKYCYALYSHKYLDSRNFFGEIFVKQNVVEKLEEKLSSKSWDNNNIINLGSVCDSYQSIEEKYKIMPEILRLLIKYKTPMMIFTKSDLILRDFDLIDKLSRLTYVNISSTITTPNKSLASIIEPNAVEPERRFKMLSEMNKTNADVGINIIPIMPMLTEDTIEALFKKSKELNLNHINIGSLIIKDECRKLYLNFIRTKFPNLYEKYLVLYKTAYLSASYQQKIDKKINYLSNKYNINTHLSITEKIKQYNKENMEQLFLF